MAEVAVIVPVIKRPEAAEPFMESIAEQLDLANVYAVAQPEDTETCEAWRQAGATVLSSPHHGYPVKVNQGYLLTEEPWLLFVGDDVQFHPGAIQEALYVAHDYLLDVVSTNDGHSPDERLKIVAPHPLMRRRYISQWGASFEGPGRVASPAYAHCCVDLEWSFIARARSVFGYAKGSVIEHHHPHFNAGAWDQIYELGKSSADADHSTFINRMMQWGPDAHA